MSKELKDHLKQQQNSNQKTRPQKDMDQITRDETIKEMLNRPSLIIGAAPISQTHIENVMKKMVTRGVLSENQPREERLQRTIKSVLKGWAYTNLQITDNQWNSIQLEEISQTY